MSKIITMPDGSEVEFPDSMSDADIEGVISQQAAPAPVARTTVPNPVAAPAKSAPVAAKPAPVPAAAVDDDTPVYDIMTGLQIGSTPKVAPEVDARKAPWIDKESARLAVINPGKSPETLRALAESRYVADPKAPAPVDRVQQYIDKGAAPINALGSANFDQKLEGKFERKYKQAKPDERGNRIDASYNPNTEADNTAKQDAEYSQQRIDARERTNAENMGPVGRGLAKGFGQTLGFGAGATAFAADAVGNEGVKKWGIDAYNSVMHTVGNIPGKEFTELESRADVADYLASTMAYGGFQAAQAFLTGGIGGAVGKQLGKQAIGQLVALSAQNVSTELGMIYGDAQEEAARTGKPPPSLAQVASMAVAAASIDTIADKIGMDSVTHLGFKGNVMSRMAKSMAMQGAVQGGTEMAQKIPEEFGAGKDPFRAGIGKEYINEGMAGVVMAGGPGVAGGVRRNSPVNEIASEIDRAVQQTEFTGIDAQVRASMSPDQNSSTVSFTRPDSPTSQAGLVPIVVPAMQSTKGGLDGNIGDPSSVAGGRGGIDSNNGSGSLASGGRLEPVAPGGLPPAQGDVSSNGAPVIPTDGSGAPAANVGLPRLAERDTDADLMARVQSALPEQTTQPATVMNGRSGKGYATESDATVAKQVGMQREPNMDWRIEPTEDGRYRVAAYESGAEAKAIDKDWNAFPAESGTLNVPRADMPQIKAEHRGALTNFLNARGITHEQVEMDPAELKPTQREFSPDKVQKAKDFTGGDRSILVSSDGHVLDGHHQWMAKKESGEAVKAIRLNAPIRDLLGAVKEFPSVQASEGATSTGESNANGIVAGTSAGLDQAPGAGNALAGSGVEDGRNQGDVAAERDQPLRTGGTVEGGSIAPDANNSRVAPAAPASVIERARASIMKDGGPKIRQSIKPLTESQSIASVVAAKFGRTFTVIESANGKGSIANGMVVGGKHVMVAADADDAPLFVTMHEVYHGMPDAQRQSLNTALLDLFNEDKRADFAKEFGYDSKDKALLDEEIPAMMAQAISRRKDFWVELRRKMGDADFAAIAKQVIAGLDSMIAAVKASYGAGFESKYIKDVEAARKLLTTAYADAVNGKPMAEASAESNTEAKPAKVEKDWQANARKKEELLAAQLATANENAAKKKDASKERPVNSKGQVITDSDAKQAAFQKWFKDSVVVDSDGRPLVMYHGTSSAGFEFFDTYASNYGLMGMGGYFTDDASVASSYTSKGKGQSPGVYSVYLSIQNPMDMEAAADPAKWATQFDGIEEFHEGGDTNESWYRAAESLLADQGLPKWEGAETMQDGLRNMGFDGITHIGGGRVNADGVKHKVFIAFDPEQIKSSTGNSGEFDSGKADISMSRRADEEDSVPPAFYRKVKVPVEVYIADEDAYETIEAPAHKALASVREDIDNYRALLKCMRG